MARDEDRQELLGAIIQTGADALDLPGASLGVSVIQWAMRHRAEARAHEFFKRLAVEIGCGEDAEAAAKRVAQEIEHPSIQDAVDRGFRLMMGAIDDAAKPCIAVLVAEYLIEKRPPDRHFQRVGALIADSVFRDLALLRGFCECAQQLGANPSSDDRVFVRDDKSPEIFLVASQGGEKERFRSKSFVGIDRGMAAVSLLTRHGLGDLWTGPSSYYFGGTPLMKFGARTDFAYLLLGRCLRALSDGE